MELSMELKRDIVSLLGAEENAAKLFARLVRYRQDSEGFTQRRLAAEFGFLKDGRKLTRVLSRLERGDIIGAESGSDEKKFYVRSYQHFRNVSPQWTWCVDGETRISKQAEKIVNALRLEENRGILLSSRSPGANGNISSETGPPLLEQTASRLTNLGHCVAFFNSSKGLIEEQILSVFSSAIRQAFQTELEEHYPSVGTSGNLSLLQAAPLAAMVMGIRPTPVIVIDGLKLAGPSAPLQSLADLLWAWSELKFVLSADGSDKIGRNVLLHPERYPLREILINSPIRARILDGALHHFSPEPSNSSVEVSVDEIRKSLLSLVDRIPDWLSSLGLYIDENNSDESGVHELMTEQIEYLAVREHARQLRLHQTYVCPEPYYELFSLSNIDRPSIYQVSALPWHQLSRTDKNALRDTISNIPELLRAADFGIGRGFFRFD